MWKNMLQATYMAPPLTGVSQRNDRFRQFSVICELFSQHSKAPFDNLMVASTFKKFPDFYEIPVLSPPPLDTIQNPVDFTPHPIFLRPVLILSHIIIHTHIYTLHLSLQKFRRHIPSHLCVLHAPPTSCSFISSPCQYAAKNAKFEAPGYRIFPSRQTTTTHTADKTTVAAAATSLLHPTILPRTSFSNWVLGGQQVVRAENSVNGWTDQMASFYHPQR
jgi:hypothetical protein